MNSTPPATGTKPSAVTAPAEPRVTFYSLIPNARLPQRADRSAAGSLPTRAFRYCEPVTTAAAFGYYVFTPITFSLMWDGYDIVWTYEGNEHGWLPLQRAQFPYFSQHFDERVPEEIQGFSPPFLASLQEPGLVNLWTGLVARTQPGWSLLVRPVANMPRRGGFELFEGVVETDRWFGPLITNMRLTKTDQPIEFNNELPIFQVQPIPREALSEAELNNYGIVRQLEDFRPEDWDDFYDTVVRPNVTVNRPRGEYAAAARRRRKAQEGGTE